MTADTGMDVSPSWQELSRRVEELEAQLSAAMDREEEVEAERERFSRLFAASCETLGAVHEALHGQEVTEIIGMEPGLVRELREERDALTAQLARYSMGAGEADQRRAESRAIRKALGFEEDADDVSPRDLLDALARLKAEWQAEVLEAEADNFKRDAKDSDSGWEKTTYMRVVRCLREAAYKARRQAEGGE